MRKQRYRRWIFLLLSVVLALSGCRAKAESSGQSEAVLAAEALQELESSRELLEAIVSDVYDAWHWSILGDGKTNCSLALLAEKLNRSENELKRGYSLRTHESSWAELSVGERQKLINQASSDFTRLLASGYSRFSACVHSVVGMYLENGSFEEAERHLQAAAELIRQLPSESEAFALLNDYYANEMALKDYCLSPTGSLEQAQTTISGYRDNARSLCAKLELIVEGS